MMDTVFQQENVNVLLIEDNLGDIRLVKEAFAENKLLNNLNVVRNGEQAMEYLYKKGEYKDAVQPDLILLDLNLPKKDGREVLEEIKNNNMLASIPVVILTTSDLEKDILESYSLHANCYITKPVDMGKFIDIVKLVKEFWFSIVKLPSNYCKNE